MRKEIQLEIPLESAGTIPGPNERIKYLQDVPGWEEKLRKYNLKKFIETEAERGFTENESSTASQRVNNINARFGPETANYVPGKGLDNSAIFRIHFAHTPTKEDFGDILDQDDRLLPYKPSEIN